MRNPKLLATAGVLAAAAIPAVPAIAAAVNTSSARLFQEPTMHAGCGIAKHPGNTPASRLVCQGNGIPGPKTGLGPFVRLGASGSPQIVRFNQDPWAGGRLRTLSKGTLWRSFGVTCNIGASTILCFNTSNHGFVIGNGKYKPF
jgi:hypothetical protein